MVSVAPREKLLQRLGHHGGDRPPRRPGMLTHPLRKTTGTLTVNTVAGSGTATAPDRAATSA